ncbi:CPBP family intramembrane glutamic endopeptidase [Phytobacter sp. V91]|uniref:CPBP family intramembrane glutamic endopeptidase n=1 Tax=Phytobacter sp. V91 TaxID=3369425 RepID=UPI003F62EF91
MLSSLTQRRHHALMCIAAVVIYHCVFFFPILLPGYNKLYYSGFAMLFVSLAFSLPCAVLLWRQYNRHYPFLSLGSFSLPIFAIGLATILVLNIIWQFLGVEEEWLMSLRNYSSAAQWASALAICVIAPFCEEVIFRGFLLNASIGWGRFARQKGIIVTSVLFALVHTQYQTPSTFVWLFTFSALLCVIRMVSGGLLIPVLLHMLNNTVALCFIFAE